MKNTAAGAFRSVRTWLCAGSLAVAASTLHCGAADLWDLAREQQGVHRFSTLFTAQDVRGRLANDAGIDTAIDWCRRTAVTKVYVETFRDGYQAERAVLEQARDRLRQAGLEVSGCVTTTQIGKPSTGWNAIACYTDATNQARIGAIFEFTAALFDEIMIDDFWFTDCQCAACDAARTAQTVTIGTNTCAVGSARWGAYHCELMVRLSRDRVLAPARQVNPRVKVIIKYPQWYDHFHERGYEVLRETADFDRIWVGTETRDYLDRRWGGTVQYEAYFIMRWLGGIGGPKCGGGWYDWLGTTEHTYIEQARQTVLGGAQESMLFCYGGLQRDTGPKNIDALRRHIPELFQVAREVAQRQPVGVAAYKPANSRPEQEPRVFDFVGMLGLPLLPCHEFPAEAPAAFFSVHALKDGALPERLDRFIAAGKPVLVTDGLAAALKGKINLDRPNVQVLLVKGDPKSLLELEPSTLAALREPLLRPLKTRFVGPKRVALYLYRDGSWVVENFSDQPAAVTLNAESLTVDARGWRYRWRGAD